MLSMNQRGFWDKQQRVAKLQEKAVLTRLTESIPWESFRLLLDKGYSQERESNAGRKRIDPMILSRCWCSCRYSIVSIQGSGRAASRMRASSLIPE
jgi:hypothetical protein